MLSATAHDGRAPSFASLISMLDATAIADPVDYSAEEFSDKDLIIRRFKKDIKNQVSEAFREREVHRHRDAASAAEELAYEALLEIRVARRGGEAGMRDLVLVSREKALFSRPAACLQTVDQRIARRHRELVSVDDPAVTTEMEGLYALRDCLALVGPAAFRRYQALLEAIAGGSPFTWSASNTHDHLVIFTERIETLRWLAKHLPGALRLKKDQVAVLHGTRTDRDKQQVVEDFGNEQRSVRVLVCSDSPQKASTCTTSRTG